MTDLSELLKQIPIGDIAEKVGASKTDTTKAVKAALPTLLSGLQANIENGGVDSLVKALSGHNTDLLTGGVNVDDIDEKDGDKIVSNVFGAKKTQVVEAVEEKAGGLGGLVSKVLPYIAPIVLTFLATKFFGGGGDKEKSSDGGFDLGGLVGGLLGGGSAGGIDLGAIAGGLFGGDDKKDDDEGGFDLGGLLGGLSGLLGGGKK